MHAGVRVHARTVHTSSVNPFTAFAEVLADPAQQPARPSGPRGEYHDWGKDDGVIKTVTRCYLLKHPSTQIALDRLQATHPEWYRGLSWHVLVPTL